MDDAERASTFISYVKDVDTLFFSGDHSAFASSVAPQVSVEVVRVYFLVCRRCFLHRIHYTEPQACCFRISKFIILFSIRSLD